MSPCNAYIIHYPIIGICTPFPSLHFLSPSHDLPFLLHHKTLHNIIPPTFLSTHSLASKTPRSVLTKRHSPGLVNPSTYPALLPLTIFARLSTSSHILFVGLLTMFILLSTGSLFQYFNPSHSLRVLIFDCVTGSMSLVRFKRSDGGGGSGPPRTTAERKPDVWRESMRVRIRFEEGTEVRPRRAREAFCRCEQTWESVTRDIVV